MKEVNVDWVRVASVDDLHEERGLRVSVDGEEVALFKRQGIIYALHNVCAHQHFSLLHEGETEGLFVSCPMHGWKYDIATGEAIRGSGKLRVYEVKIQGDEVLLKVPTI